MTEYKIKPLTKEQIIISIDRLTRFKQTETKYLRVFEDILTHNLLSPKYKKSELEKKDYSELAQLASEIINYSLECLDINSAPNFNINKKLLEYEKSLFKLNSEVEKLLENKINYSSCLKLISENSVQNLRWLKTLETDSPSEILREKYSLKYPLEMVLIVEGATEEILLPVFAQICGFDFDKQGVYLLSAGGKNQVVKLYYELVNCLKIPIFVLLDKDGIENYREIQPRLRTMDNIYVLESGEFEDLLSTSLIQRSLEYEFENISMLDETFNDIEIPRVKHLEEIFKKRGRHEFKKVEFAQIVQKNISGETDITPEIRVIVDKIEKTKNKK